jgi:SAM-dependent methyltransferase
LTRALFTLTIFLSSALLFLVQPLVARMILPAFGGSPAVWTASMVFFQAFLLFGYAYAHWSTKALGARKQPWMHIPVLAIAALSLPFSLPAGRGALGASDPTAGLLLTLALMVGMSFFAISAGAPLLQRWFATTKDPHARDPYFLYSASNLGSMLALLVYPFVIEPRLPLGDQARLWAGGYVVLVLFMAVCALVTLRAPRAATPVEERPVEALAEVAEEGATWRERGLWLALSAVPSSLLLGVTAFLTLNVAPVPLLWVVPLALYLLTFIVAFARRQLVGSSILGRIVPLFVTPLALVIILESEQPLIPLAVFHLFTFFLIALMCHVRLNETRPAASRLTEFYLWISLGGVLGGIFNAILAPVLFDTLAEYPIALVAAVMLRPAIKAAKGGRGYLFPVAVGVLALVAVLVTRQMGMEPGAVRTMLTVGIPLVLAMVAMDFPVRYGLTLGAVFLVAAATQVASDARLVRVERSFFGVHRVTVDGRFVKLLHGNTIHGRQDRENPGVPLTYYHPTGPIGSVFRTFEGDSKIQDVALIGLGVGSLAAYGEPGQRLTFFEIDPTVEQIARDPNLFTFLRDSEADVRVVLGDARLTLAQQPDNTYGLIVLDAFSSDAIPVHLLTLEALQMYLRKLKPDGILAIHISNRYLDLEPVIAAAAQELNLSGLVFWDAPLPDEAEEGKTASVWAAVARDEESFGPLILNRNWVELEAHVRRKPWTDGWSDVLSTFRQE